MRGGRPSSPRVHRARIRHDSRLVLIAGDAMVTQNTAGFTSGKIKANKITCQRTSMELQSITPSIVM